MWIPKEEERHYFCHKCSGELVFEVKMQRTDMCPHCGADLHCCKNCEYHDPGAHNQCTETIAEYVSDRHRANHCTHLKFKSGERESVDKDSAKAKLEALFKKR
jgi:transcription initiation factor IIE alpha subunit